VASGPSAPRPTPRPAPLRLTVWLDDCEGWHARALWGRGQVREFDSPFELARFLARFGDVRRSPRPGGLR
jgi:hypothetical protein